MVATKSSSLIASTSTSDTGSNMILKVPSGSGWASGKFVYAYQTGGYIVLQTSTSGEVWTANNIFQISSFVPPDSIGSNQASDISLAVDSSGNPYVTCWLQYHIASLVSRRCTLVIYYRNGAWNTTYSYSIVDYTTGGPYDNTIGAKYTLFDSSNNLNIFFSYIDNSVASPRNSGIAHIKMTYSGVFTNEYLTQVPGGLSNQYVVRKAAIDSSGYYHILFNESVSSTAYYYNNNTNTSVALDSSPSYARDMVIDTLGNIHFLWINTTTFWYNYKSGTSFGTPQSFAYTVTATTGGLITTKPDGSIVVILCVIGGTSSAVYLFTKATTGSSFSGATSLSNITGTLSPNIIKAAQVVSSNYVYFIYGNNY